MKKLLSILILSLFFFPLGGYAASYNWEFVGWDGGGAYPNTQFDSNVPNRVYLTSDVAGIWRSDDLGDHWHFINNGLGNLMVSDLITAPSDANVLYAATQGGLYYSTNAGGLWQPADTAQGKITFIRPNNYRSIAVDPHNANHVCVGTQYEDVFCSKNNGLEWTQIPLPVFIADNRMPIPSTFFSLDGTQLFVAFYKRLAEYNFTTATWRDMGYFNDKINDAVIDYNNMLYVASGSNVWYKKPAYQTWKPSSPVPKGLAYRICWVGLKGNKIRLFVLYRIDPYGGMAYSDDMGQTWQNRNQNLAADLLSDPTRSWAEQTPIPESLKADPHNANVLFRTDEWGVWRSDDAGSHWAEKILGAPNTVATDIALGYDGHIFLSSMDDGLLESLDEGKTYHALFPKQVYQTSTTGHIWRVLLPGNGDVVATSSPWGEDKNQVILSTNGGQSFQLVTNGLPATRPKTNTIWSEGYPRALAIDPQNPNIMYLGIDGDDGGGLFISKDGGLTWSHTKGQPGSKRVYHGLAVDPTDSKTIVWGAVGGNGGVYISTDGGQTFNWALRDMNSVFNLAIDPTGTIYAAGSYGGPALFVSDSQKHFHLLKSFNDGVGDALDGIAISPINSKIIAVSTVSWSNASPCQIFLTRDAGKTWEQINGDLPDGAGASEMTFDDKGQYLYIARYAGSAYRVKI